HQRPHLLPGLRHGKADLFERVAQLAGGSLEPEFFRCERVRERPHARDELVNSAGGFDKRHTDLSEPLWVGFIDGNTQIPERLLRDLYGRRYAHKRFAQALAGTLELLDERHDMTGESVENLPENGHEFLLCLLGRQVHETDALGFDVEGRDALLDLIQRDANRAGGLADRVHDVLNDEVELASSVLRQRLRRRGPARAAEPVRPALGLGICTNVEAAGD